MPLPPSSPPLTRAESSNYQHTSLHRDVLDYIEALRARDDNRLHVSDFGSSPEGRRLPLLVLSHQGIRSPEAARGVLACGLAPDPQVGEEFPAWRVHAIEP